VLIPEAQDFNVRLDRFIAVMDEIPERKFELTDDLWPMKDQLKNIRKTLIAEGKLQCTPTPELLIAEVPPTPLHTDHNALCKS
jgi:hypothetical protein